MGRLKNLALVALATTLSFGACGDESGGDLNTFSDDTTDRLVVRKLRVLSIKPSTGDIAGGTLVMMTGTGFQPDMLVRFGDIEARGVFVGGDELAVMETPPGLEAGPVDVFIELSDGRNANVANAFTYTKEEEVLADFQLINATPSFGSVLGGNIVVFEGKGFVPDTDIIFGTEHGRGCKFISSEAITCFAPPALSPGLVDIRAETPELPDQPRLTDQIINGYDYVPEEDVEPEQMRVLGVIPASGPLSGGVTITIKGQAFAEDATVRIDGKLATEVEVVGREAITCTLPEGTNPGLVDVVVDNPGDNGAVGASDRLVDGFTYIDDTVEEDPLLILTVNPNTGPLTGGNLVAIGGSGFVPGASVYFGGNLAPTTEVLGSQAITCIAPAGAAAGTVQVRVELPNNTAFTLAESYTYIDTTVEPDALLALSAIPAEGPLSGGTHITLAGQGFEPGAEVYFGGVNATQVDVLGPTAMSLVVPAGLAPGMVNIRVEVPTGAAHTLVGGYTYIDDTITPDTLIVANVLPGAGPLSGGNNVTLGGQGFQQGAIVYFGGVTGPPCTLLGSTAMICTAPPGIVPGFVNLRVELPAPPGGGPAPSYNLPSAYEYIDDTVGTDAMLVLGVLPSEGGTSGGQLVTITGQGFESGAEVTFGGIVATSINVLGPTAITARTPPGQAGLTNVRVDNPGGDGDLLVNGFQYVDDTPQSVPLLVLRAIPNEGPLEGGNTVTLEGSGFADGAKVFVGGTEASAITVLGPTALTFEAPANATPGFVEIEVEMPGANGVAGATHELANAYEYVGTVANNSLLILDVIPDQGSIQGGNFVAISGNGFSTGATVLFGGIPATGCTVLGTNTITCTAPQGAIAGAVDVRVELQPVGGVAGDAATLAGAYTFVDDVAQPDPLLVLGAIPNQGPLAGGNTVTVTGTGFEPGMRVYFDGVVASDVTVLAASALTVEAPPGSDVGFVDIRVELQSATGAASTLVNGYRYFDDGSGADQLTLVNVIPDEGPLSAQTLVTITGSGFEDGMQIFVGTAECASLDVLAPTAISCVMPVGTTPGLADMRAELTTGESFTRSGAFTYIDDTILPDDLLLVEAIPAVGPLAGNNVVTLAGQGFDAGMAVYFAGMPATQVQVLGPNAATCLAPAGVAPGAVDVRVEIPSGPSSTAPGAYQYIDTSVAPDPLRVIRVLPASGPVTGGESLTIEGTGFTLDTNIYIGGAPANNCVVLGPEAINCNAPAGSAVGPVDVRAEDTSVNGGSDTLVNGYTYEAVLNSILGITSVYPVEGSEDGGNLVLLTGTGFMPGMTVTFGSEASPSVSVLSENSATAVTPPSTAGLVDVVLTSPTGAQVTQPNSFRFLPEAVGLLVLNVIPANGPIDGGTTVTVAGQGFVPGATVSFDGVAASSVNYLGPNAITCVTPAGIDAGLANVEVELPPVGGNPGDSHTLANAFTYLAVSLDLLSVATVYPITGTESGDDLVLLTGTGFHDAMTVRFGGVPSPLVKVLTKNSATALTPAHPPGAVNVQLLNPDGAQDVLPNGFSFLSDSNAAPTELPAIGAVLPGTGPVAGGTTIRIIGDNFTAGSAVTLDGVAATQVTVVSQNLITAVVPAGTAGPVSVTVTDTAGQADTLVNGFTYLDPPTLPVISALWPVSGPNTGGTWVVVDGTNFNNPATVFFGGVPATATQFVGPNRLIAVSPAGNIGSVDVSVVNPDGGWDTATDGFSYYDANSLSDPPPVIATIFPAVGTVDGGTSVSVVGANFQAGARIFFGSAEATVTASPTSTNRDVTTPANPPGSTSVTVVNPDGLTHSLNGAFVYFSPPPLISVVSPDVGSTAGGYEVTLIGKNFRSDSSVQWGNFNITAFNSQTPTSLSFFAPPAVPGPIDVTVSNSDGQTDTALSAFTYLNAASLNTPSIISIDPATGPSPGGYLALITGQNFLPTASVHFGLDPATSVVVHSSTLIQVTVPPGVANSVVDVTVENAPGDSDTMVNGFTYGGQTAVPLAVRSVTPGTGPTTGGTVVTISGDGFTPGTVVLFAGVAAPSVDIISTTQLTAVTPAGAAGLVSVRVERPDMQSATAFNAFAYYNQSTVGQGPRVLSLDPIVGPLTGGSLVLIQGQQFGNGAVVYFGASQAPVVTVLDANRIVAETPAATTPGTVAVSVTNTDGLVDVLSGAYTYYDASSLSPPEVFIVQPAQGPTFGGDQINIVGDLFGSGIRAYICDRPATVLSLAGDDTLTVLTPANAPGDCDVAVVNANGLTGRRAQVYEYISPSPVVTSLTPAIGPTAGGQDVVIQGGNFVPGATVKFGNGSATSVVVSDPNTLACRTPANVLGPVDVTVINPGAGQPSGTLANGFTYVDAINGNPPDITSVAPGAGPLVGGTPVRIFGTNFDPAAVLLFDGVQPPSLQFVDATELRFTTPPSATAGSVALTVLNPDGLGDTLPNAFTYAAPTSPPPTISSVVPSQGPEAGGNTITLTGSNFSANGQWFIDGAPLASAATISSTLVTAQAPSHAPGLVGVSYVGPDGQVASKLNAYEFLPAPKLTSLQPSLGGVAGGSQLTAIGDNFKVGMQIWFGPIQGSVLTVSSPSTATVQTPPRPIHGFVDVRVVNPDGQEHTLVDGYEYLAVPELTSVWPPTGPTTGGTLVEVDGSGLHTGSKIFFGANEATAVYFDSFNRVYALTPANPALLTVDVKVVNPDGEEFVLASAFEYTDPATLDPPPVITNMFPPRGPSTGGTRVALDGLNFHDDAHTIFLANRAVIDSVRADRIVAVAPAHDVGTAQVWVVNPDGRSVRSTVDFTYLDPTTVGATPVVNSMAPIAGPTAGDTTVTLVGTGFQTGAVVRFGDTDGVEVTNVPTQIETDTPARAAGSVAVWVVNPDGTQAQAPSTFLFLPPPTVTSVQPNQGPANGDTAVTIYGQNLLTDPNGTEPDIIFCSDYAAAQGCASVDPADVTVLTNGTQISLMSPPHAPGLVDVAVVSPDGQTAVVVDAFTFTAIPTIATIAPNSGPIAGGTTVTVTGTAFQTGVFVLIDNQPCTNVVLVTSTQLTCVTPMGTVGPADVVVGNLDGGAVTATDGYTFLPAPVVSSVTPNTGPNAGGQTVTIQGANFSTTTKPRVFFGTVEVPAADVTVQSATVLQVEVPAGAGSVDIRVRNPDLQEGFLLDGYVYIPPLPTPIILFVTPPSGEEAGGDPIQIVGNNFLAGATAFVGDATANTWTAIGQVVISNNTTTIVGVTPAATAGDYDVRVVNPDGQEAIATDAFTYLPPPDQQDLDLISIQPSRSIVAGGGYVTIAGTGFRPGVTVRFGTGATAQLSPEVTRFGPTLMRAKVPPAPGNMPGAVTIRLTNPPTATLPVEHYDAVDVFEYVDGPVFVVDPGDRLFNEGRDDRGALIFDADGDGLNDVLVFQDGRDRLAMNGRDGKAGFFSYRAFASNSNNATDFAAAHDFDNDGDLDVIRETRNAEIWYCENVGGGDFPSCSAVRGYNSYCNLSDLVVEDFNCDGKADILMTYTSTDSRCRTGILVGNGGGSFSYTTAPFPATTEPTRGVSAADVDGDNDIDILMSNDSNVQNRLYLNNCADIQLAGQCDLPLAGYAGWIFGGKAYTRSQDANLRYHDAKTYCSDRGLKMAEIDNQALEEFFNSVTNYHFWVPMIRPSSGAAFEWDSTVTSSTSTYTNWCTNEPNTNSYLYAYYNRDADCWYDVYTSWNGAYAFCESQGTACSSAWGFQDAQYGAGLTFPVTGGNTRDVLLVDIDDDGDKDAIIANYVQQILVFMNIGGKFIPDDGFRWPQNEANKDIHQLRSADIDMDGDQDVIATFAGNEVKIYVNDRYTVFACPAGAMGCTPTTQQGIGAYSDQTAECDSNGSCRWPNGDGKDSRTDVTGMTVGDLDGDDLPDVYLVGRTYSDRMIMNNGYEDSMPWIDTSRVAPGWFRHNAYRRLPERRDRTLTMRFGDLNADGETDIVKGPYDGPLAIYSNDGAGKMIDVSAQVLPTETTPNFRSHEGATSLADIDGDGDLDIIFEATSYTSGSAGNNYPITTGPHRRRQYINNGTGTFTDLSAINQPLTIGRTAQGTVIHDFDNDGDLDILHGHNYSSYTPYMFINGGDVWNVGGAYFFDETADWQVNASSNYRYVTDMKIIDLNGDAYADLYIGRNGQNRVWLNNGGTSFSDVTVDFSNSASDNTRHVLAEDFDNDGDKDIIALNSGGNRYHFRDSAAAFADITATAGVGSGNTYGGSAGDVDCDGFVDFYTGNYTEKNGLYLNLGGTEFLDISVNLPWDVHNTRTAYLVDWDGDGDLDVFVGNDSDQDRFYLNTTDDPSDTDGGSCPDPL